VDEETVFRTRSRSREEAVEHFARRADATCLRSTMFLHRKTKLGDSVAAWVSNFAGSLRHS
jgi:hypothetical protein